MSWRIRLTWWDVTLLAIMMMVNWSRAPKGIRIMATKLGMLRIPAGLILIALAAFLVFGQDL